MTKVKIGTPPKFKVGDRIRNMKVGDVFEVKGVDLKHRHYITDHGYLLFEYDDVYEIYDPSEVCIKDTTGHVIGTTTLKHDKEKDIWQLNIKIMSPGKMSVVVTSVSVE